MHVKIDPSLASSLEAAITPAEKTIALFAFLSRTGQGFYDESVTQLEHALQAAHLAKESGATSEQITAALLHDIGHFLTDEHSHESDFQTEDWDHESVGAEQIHPFFPESVTEPIRLHVPAKRYLCTVETKYFQGLSPASQRSFQLQGGAMSDAEIAEFEANRFYQSAVQLRRWDDGAKVKDWQVPDLEFYREDVESCIQ